MTEVVVIGLGQLGALFAEGLLRSGRTVVPVLRGMRTQDVAQHHPEPELVLVTVAEDDLAPVLEELPHAWRERIGLLQNELVPATWQERRIEEPTVAVIWFEKKAGRAVQELLPTVIRGPRAALLVEALSKLDISARVVGTDSELVRALVEKNLYILVTNISGLEVGGTVRELWSRHRELAEAVADDVIQLEQALTRAAYSRPELIAALERAIDADPDHACMGRTASARLSRALKQGARLGLELPKLRRIAESRA